MEARRCCRRRLYCSRSEGPPRRSSPAARRRCTTTMSVIRARASAWAPSSRPELRPIADVQDLAGNRQDPHVPGPERRTGRPSTSVTGSTSVPSTRRPWRRTGAIACMPTCRTPRPRSGSTARSTSGIETIPSAPSIRTAPSSSRSTADSRATSGAHHRDRLGDSPQAASARHHLLRPRPDHVRARASSGRDQPERDGEVEVQDREVRRAILAGHRCRRHDLPRRRCRLSPRLPRQGAGKCPGRAGGPRRIWKYQVSSFSPGLTASPVISADSTTLYIGTSSTIPGLPWASPRSTSPTRPASAARRRPATRSAGRSRRRGKVDQTPALAADGTLYVPAMDGGQKRLYAVNPNGTQKWVFGPISLGVGQERLPHRRRRWRHLRGHQERNLCAERRHRNAALGLSDDQLHPRRCR